MEIIGNLDVERLRTDERQTLLVQIAKKFNILEVQCVDCCVGLGSEPITLILLKLTLIPAQDSAGRTFLNVTGSTEDRTLVPGKNGVVLLSSVP